MAGSITTTAQLQIQNGGFEQWDNEGAASIEPAHWNSFKTSTGSWNSMGGQQVEKSDDVRPGSTGTSSVRIYARSILGTIAQGNLTTGRINMGSTSATDATGNYNYTQTDNADFHQKFTGLPDAIRFWAKVSCQIGGAVSCNLHTNGYFQDPVVDKNTATIVAKASNTSIQSSQSWQELVVPFSYNVTDGTRPEYALITFMTSGQPGKGNKNDYMFIDDFEFLYYSELESATLNGRKLQFTDGKATTSQSYDAQALVVTSNGHGATVKVEYIASANEATITIEGEDIDTNPSNRNVYTIAFEQSGGDEPGPEPTPQSDAPINLPNGDFEQWNSAAGQFLQVGRGERTRPGSEPAEWCSSSVDLLGGIISRSVVKATTVSEMDGGEGEGKFARLANATATYYYTHSIPAFITLGSQWAYNDLLFSSFNQGVYGGIDYTLRPDAIQGQFRRIRGSSTSDENAHIIAYMWTGSFKSKVGDASDPDTEVTDAADAVLGKTETTESGQLIASCDYAFSETKDNEWQTIVVPLEYNDAAQQAKPEKLNVIISSADIWNINDVTAGNILDVDNLTMLFYSELEVAEYNSNPISFVEGRAEVNTPYDSYSLYLRTNSHSAIIDKFYDEDTGLLTIDVKGGDINTNPNNHHTYYIQFEEPSKVVYSRVYTDDLLVSINGTENPVRETNVIFDEMKDGSYTLSLENFYMGDDIEGKYYVGSIIIDNLTIGSDGSFSTARTLQIQAGNKPADVQWIGPMLGNVPIDMDGRITDDSLHTHIVIDLQGRMGQLIDVKFGKSLIEQSRPHEEEPDPEPEPDPTKPTITLSGKHSYTDELVVSINGEAADPQRTSIEVEFNDDNTLNLALYNFSLPSGDDVMYVGNVALSNVPYTLKAGLPYATFNSTKVVTITEGSEPTDAIWLGPMLGEIPITLKGKVGTDKLTCTIDIMMGGVGAIHVTFGNDQGWPEVGPGEEPEEDPILRNYTYSGPLSVMVNGETNTPQTANVTMETNDDGTVNLTLRNFYMELSSGERMPIGNIRLTGITPVEVSNLGYYMFMSQQDIVIEPGDDSNEMWIGPLLQEIPITMSGKLARWKMFANISIFMADMGENVRVVFGEDFADSIGDLKGKAATGKAPAIYTLSGQQLRVIPKAGLYIINGRKVVVQ